MGNPSLDFVLGPLDIGGRLPYFTYAFQYTADYFITVINKAL